MRRLAFLIVLALLSSAPARALQVRLTWRAVANSAGYRVYWRGWGESYGVGYNAGKLAPDADGVVRYTLPVAIDPPVYFAVTNIDAEQIESPFSNEALLRAELRCASAPLDVCVAPSSRAGSVLAVRNPDGVSRDQLGWSWRQGPPGVGFGDPSRDTGYLLCVYDSSRGAWRLATQLLIPAGAAGDGGPFWRPLGTRGFTYAMSGAGFLKVKLKRRPDGRESIVLKAGGAAAALPDVAPDPLFQQDPTVIAQLVNDDVPPRCWSAGYGAPARTRPARFQDKSD